jgi:glycosyltransferase involved in cell wall biosynthesis
MYLDDTLDSKSVEGYLMNQLIVCDWIESHGGAEQVVKQMLSVLPEADVFTLWSENAEFSNRPVFESKLSKGPWRRHKGLSVPLMIPTFSKISFPKEVDRLIVSTHSFAHHAKIVSNRGNPSRFTYVHSPARYIWAPDLDTRGSGFLQTAGRKIFRKLDVKSPVSTGKIASNSEYIAQRILKAWGLEVDSVIYPPVRSKQLGTFSLSKNDLKDSDFDQINRLPKEFILTCGRLVEYKNHGDAIHVGKTLGLPVIVAGSGPDQARLVILARELGVDLLVIERPSDSLLHALISLSTYTVFAAIEDFGILTVEALALGAKVMVNRLGGSGEIVKDGESGVYVDFSSPTSIADSATRGALLSKEKIQLRSLDFDESIFQKRFLDWITDDSRL